MKQQEKPNRWTSHSLTRDEEQDSSFVTKKDKNPAAAQANVQLPAL